jgi:hypothetical protein
LGSLVISIRMIVLHSFLHNLMPTLVDDASLGVALI